MIFSNINNNIYIKNEEGEKYIIIPNCFFNTRGIVNLNNSKLKAIHLNINRNKKEHEKFINEIRKIYDECSEHIEINDEFNPNIIINPLRKINDAFFDLLIYVTDWNGNLTSTFYNANKENQIINLEEIENKQFSIYVAIQIDKISLSSKNNNAYINFSLKEGYINNINEKENNKKLIDYKKVQIAINSENSI